MAIGFHHRVGGYCHSSSVVNYPLSIIAFLLALTPAGCAPSVRYVADRPMANTQSQARPLATPRRDAPPRPVAGTVRRPQRLLEQTVESYIGTPYRYGGTTRSGVDCSGFVMLVYKEVYGVRLPRSSGKMWNIGRQIHMAAARPGDLVFFKGGTFGQIDHVGIYMGNNRFVHSSTSKGVVYSNLNETYYARRFAGARRII